MNVLEQLKSPKILVSFISVMVILIVWMPIRSTLNLLEQYYTSQQSISRFNLSGNDEIDPHYIWLLDRTDYAQQIFSTLSFSCQANNVIIRDIGVPKHVVVKDLLIERHEVMLEGTFVNILKSAHQAGEQLPMTKLVSVNFEREGNDSKKLILTSKLVFQTVKPLENE